MDGSIQFLIGHHDSKRDEPISKELASSAYGANYDMLTFPITTPHFHSRVLSILSAAFSASSGTTSNNSKPVVVEPLSPLDSQLTPHESINSIIATTSTWIDLSSPDPIIADISRQVLRLELAYAAFCGVSYVLINGPRHAAGSDIAAYARSILDGLDQGPYVQLYLWFPTHPDVTSTKEPVADLASFCRREYLQLSQHNENDSGPLQSWQAWDIVRTTCKYSTRLNVALAIQIHLPPPVVQSRWYSEPVRILTFDVDAFRNNAKGYPALPQDHQNYFHKLMKLKSQPWLLMCDATPLKTTIDPGKANDSNFPALKDATNLPTTEDDHYVQYLRHLQTKQSTQTPMDQFGAGYQDYLQAPLQPLTVNLESVTYEVFEKDPIKYEWYERAVARALHDWCEQGKPTSNPDGRVVVAIVGAGRGPLVSRALKAAEDVGVEIDTWALEKNPNAYVLLQRHNQNKWDNKVTLVKSDMRTWQGPQTNKMLSKVQKTFNVDAEDQSASTAPPTIPLDATLDPHTSASHVSRYKIDILISELLGSFADNELSPECLDGVQHLMNPIHGISVPRSYTAHFTPVAAPKLHADISLSMTHVNPHAAEIPYVVMFDQVDFLSTTTATKEDTSTTSSPTKPKTFASLLSKPRVSNASTNSTRTTIPPPTPVISTAWEFVHPNPLVSLPPVTNSHNARYGRFTFPTPHQGTCHGLAGYFETVLYPGVELSTNPLTMEDKSSGMISWFPIFFPFKKPIFLPDNGEVDVSMWRMTDDRKVWYEWVMEVYMIIDANEGKAKRRHKVGATDLHSSEKEACLM